MAFMFNRSAGELYLSSGKFSDLILVCEGREFKVHRMVLCTRSPVFSAECDGPFKEAAEGRIEVGIESATTLKHMLDYLYLGSYDIKPAQVAEEEQPKMHPNAALLAHLKVMTLADYYQISDLVTLALSNFFSIIPACKPSHDENTTYQPWTVDGLMDLLHCLPEANADKGHVGYHIWQVFDANRRAIMDSESFMLEALEMPDVMQHLVQSLNNDHQAAQSLYEATAGARDAEHAGRVYWKAKASEVEETNRKLEGRVAQCVLEKKKAEAELEVLKAASAFELAFPTRITRGGSMVQNNEKLVLAGVKRQIIEVHNFLTAHSHCKGGLDTLVPWYEMLKRRNVLKCCGCTVKF